jgi:hypothetical protein
VEEVVVTEAEEAEADTAVAEATTREKIIKILYSYFFRRQGNLPFFISLHPYPVFALLLPALVPCGPSQMKFNQITEFFNREWFFDCSVCSGTLRKFEYLWIR